MTCVKSNQPLHCEQPLSDTDTKTRILDTTWALVHRRGNADITMGEIADAVGISRQALYLHFPNRASLLVATVQRFDDLHIDLAARDRRRALPPVESLVAGLRWWLGYLPRLLPVATALEAAALVNADGAAAWRDRMQLLRGSIRFYVQRLADAKLLADGWTVETAVDWVWARTTPAFWSHLVADRGWKPTRLADRLIASIVAEVVRPHSGRRSARRSTAARTPAKRKLR
ncbi:MAG: TetR/AcrR family transcriptional regulator [Gemmatimonadaceae bacterium]